MTRLPCLVVMALLPCLAGAQLRPAGPEFPLVYATNVVPRVEHLQSDGFSRFLYLHGGGWSAPLQVERLDKLGRPLGPPIDIASPYVFRITPLAFAVAPQGHFLVAWSETDMGYYQRYYGIIGPDGAWRFDGVLQSDRVCATATPGGHLLVAQRTPEGFEVRAHNAMGMPILSPIGVAATGSSCRLRGDAQGNFWIWIYGNPTNGPPQTLSQRFTLTGEKLTPLEPSTWSAAAVCPSGRLVSFGCPADEPRPPGSACVLVREPDGAPTGALYSAVLDPAPSDPLAVCDAAENVVLTWVHVTGEWEDYDVYAARFRNDGTLDGPAFRASSGSESLNIWPQLAGDPQGNVLLAWWHDPLGLPPPMRARAFHVPPKGDFDGDLAADLVLRHEATGATRLWLMDEGVRVANLALTQSTPDAEWLLAGAGDFNGDRRQDLVFQRQHGEGQVVFVFLAGAGGNEVSGSSWLSGGEPRTKWQLAAVCDFDGDGWPDLLWRHITYWLLEIWTMRGTQPIGWLVPQPHNGPRGDWRLLAAQDWNGDGTCDLLWSDSQGRLVQWLMDQRAVARAERFTDPPAASDSTWGVVAVGDFGVGPAGVAGASDVVWRSSASGRQVIWFLDTTGRRTAGIFITPLTPGDPAWQTQGPR